MGLRQQGYNWLSGYFYPETNDLLRFPPAVKQQAKVVFYPPRKVRHGVGGFQQVCLCVLVKANNFVCPARFVPRIGLSLCFASHDVPSDVVVSALYRIGDNTQQKQKQKDKNNYKTIGYENILELC